MLQEVINIQCPLSSQAATGIVFAGLSTDIYRYKYTSAAKRIVVMHIGNVVS